jgi:hypothetical protein
MYNFTNCILVVVFNYSDCVHNKDVLKDIYGKHFKQIIFYSDYTVIEEESEVNFVQIQRGFFTHRLFKHLYDKYKSVLDESDGLFYTMDDNIINVNILNLYDSNKIIYYKSNLSSRAVFSNDTLDDYSGWWWDTDYGNKALQQLLNDKEFQKYNIQKFSGSFSDWFYLPKKYLTNELFELFELFAKYDIFLEIAIPSVIHNIIKDDTQYQNFTNEVLWDDRGVFLSKDYIHLSLNKAYNLILHPIKFSQNPESKGWLREFFCKEKCVIITTIHKPTEAIWRHINNSEYDVIIVGDNKTPDHYNNINCTYLDIPSQQKLFPEFSDILPYNHYCRKNIGYLYAIKRGYKVIYETDDDNVPHDGFDVILRCRVASPQMVTEQNSKWINIFRYFTNAYVWPRGFPLSLFKKYPNYLVQTTDKNPSIINGLVENDPDVDALFRIVCTHEAGVVWDKNMYVLVDNNNVCVFNSQNTFWLNPEIFMGLLLPCSVSFRYCDILRGIIANILLRKTGNYMMYSSPNVVQYRNEHDIISDFKSEYEMYIHNEKILDFIENGIENVTCPKELLRVIYGNLLEHGVITQKDLDVLDKWLAYF